MATHHGHLAKFDGNAEDWEIFTEQLSHYLAANGVTDEAKKRSFLLSACGTPTYKLIRTLVAPATLTDKSFNEIAELVQNHYQPRSSVIMRRFRFNTCIRHQGEGITAFMARLRDLASHCDYWEATAELIRDRIVCGIRNDVLQRSLLAVTKLTFEKACELALQHESAEENSKVLSAPTAVHRTEREAPAFAHLRRDDSTMHPGPFREPMLPLRRAARRNNKCFSINYSHSATVSSTYSIGDHLIELPLNLLPLMYWLELQDMMFLIKLLKEPADNFNILDYISFSTTSTRSDSTRKLKSKIIM